jgi:hypothetical protein
MLTCPALQHCAVQPQLNKAVGLKEKLQKADKNLKVKHALTPPCPSSISGSQAVCMLFTAFA